MYFWTITRCFDLENKELSQLINERIRATFMEDVEVLEAQQRLIETDRRNVADISIRADSGSISARRIVQRLSEQSALVE